MTNSFEHLNGTLNLNFLVQDACVKLKEVLKEDLGPKALVWDEHLTRPMDLVAGYSLLKQLGVVRMVSLAAGLPPAPDSGQDVATTSVVFLVRPELSLMHKVADIVSEEVRRHGVTGGRQLVLCFVPERSEVCERVLDDLRALHLFTTVTELAVRLFPLDADLVSMEYPHWFKEHALENDIACHFRAAQALISFQERYGVAPHVYIKGDAGSKVYECMTRLRRDALCRQCALTAATATSAPFSRQIDCLILLDRSVDLLTPMATQLTYEGLIDEIFGVETNSVRLPADKFARSEGASIDLANTPKQIVLNSSEELYTGLRDKNFNAVGPLLSKNAKIVSSQYEERQLGNIGDMKNFVRNVLPTIKAAKESLTLHTTVAEMIKEHTDKPSFLEALTVEQEFMNAIDTDKPHAHIEKLIATHAPLKRVLRLICMQCWCAASGGVAGGAANGGGSGACHQLLARYRRDLLRTYGFQHALTLDNLQRAGLMTATAAASAAGYPAVMRSLRLIVDDVSELQPTDVAYTFSGYAPISIRVVQQLSKYHHLQHHLNDNCSETHSNTDKTNGSAGGVDSAPWRAVVETLSQLSGPTLYRRQYEDLQRMMACTPGPTDDCVVKRPLSTTTAANLTSSPSQFGTRPGRGGRRVCVVVMLGGATFAEMAALRFLSSRPQANSEYVLVTTNMVNGSSLIESLTES